MKHATLKSGKRVKAEVRPVNPRVAHASSNEPLTAAEIAEFHRLADIEGDACSIRHRPGGETEWTVKR